MSMPTTGKLAGLIKTGTHRAPLRVLLYGPEGIGKTTWAAGAADAVFIGTEDGHGDLDIARMPPVTTWDDVRDALRLLLEEPHDFQTVVIDTIDHFERLVWDSITNGGGIEDVGGGYGKGYTAALEKFQRLGVLLDELRDVRGMNVILLGHAVLEKVSNPEGADYDKFTLKMHKKAAAFWKEWSDVVLFAHMDVKVISGEKNGDKALLKKGKAKGGDRVVETTGAIAYDAKNRYSLPETLPLEWEPFARAIRFNVDYRKPPKAAGRAAPAPAPAPAPAKPPERTLDELRTAAVEALSAAGILPIFAQTTHRPASEWSRTDITNAGAAIRRFNSRTDTEKALDKRLSLTLSRIAAAGIDVADVEQEHGPFQQWSHDVLTKITESLPSDATTDNAATTEAA